MANNSHHKCSRPAFVILLVHFVTKFSQAAIGGALPLYFVDKLRFDESEATVAFHVLEITLCSFSLVGGLVADSYLGMYKVLLCSLSLISIGLVTLAAATVPPLHLPLHELTFIALILLNIGYGIKAPCISSFGGDQFLLPQQEKKLSLFFMQLYAILNIASVLATLISPILRKDIRCFGELSCYSLEFVTPAVMVLIGLGTFFATKRLFRLRKPQGNITIKVIRCVCHAFSRKLKSNEKKGRLLNYANDKYESEFIEDIRSALQTFVLLLPTTILSALVAAEATTVTFQASRMNGEIADYLIKPDQVQIVRAISLIVALPTFHYYVYPFLAKFFRVNTHLRKMGIGLFIGALSYYTAAIVELNLERSYVPKPTKGNAHLRIYNTVNCKAVITIDQQKITIDELDAWENLNIMVTEKKILQYSVGFKHCTLQPFLSKKVSDNFTLLEKQANSFALTEDNLSYKFIDHNDRSDSGNPLVRALIYMGTDVVENNMKLKIRMKQEVFSEIPIYKNITKSDYFEVVHGMYTIYLDNQKIQADVPLKVGGVYTILGHISNSSRVAQVITMTPPNSMHILWLLPQQILLSVAIIMFDPICIDFLYTRAPPSMKAFIQSYPDISLAIGHIIVVIITYTHFFDRKVFVFLLYAVLMTTATIIFTLLARSYEYPPIKKHDSQQDDADQNLVR